MTCPRCVLLEAENRRLRAVVDELWLTVRERWKQSKGNYASEPVPPLMMARGDTFEITEEAA